MYIIDCLCLYVSDWEQFIVVNQSYVYCLSSVNIVFLTFCHLAN